MMPTSGTWAVESFAPREPDYSFQWSEAHWSLTCQSRPATKMVLLRVCGYSWIRWWRTRGPLMRWRRWGSFNLLQGCRMHRLGSVRHCIKICEAWKIVIIYSLLSRSTTLQFRLQQHECGSSWGCERGNCSCQASGLPYSIASVSGRVFRYLIILAPYLWAAEGEVEHDFFNRLFLDCQGFGGVV